jgi:hypothetical protein
MIELRTRLLVSLLVFLATALQASPQTAQGGPPTSRVVVSKTGKPGNSRSSPPSGSISGASPGLCFHPGVGWQSNVTEQPSESATRDTHTSMGLEIDGSSATANPQSLYARLSTAKQAHAAQCAGILTDKRAPEAEAKKFTILDHSSTIRFAGSKKPGGRGSREANSPFHPSGSAGLKPVWMTQSATPSAAKYFGSAAGPDEPSDQASDRTFHAYISSIKLRRLIRIAPDFRTRIKLQQLQNLPATKWHIAGVDTKTGQVAKRSPQGERIGPTSSLRSDARDRPRNNTRTLLSGAQ